MYYLTPHTTCLAKQGYKGAPLERTQHEAIRGPSMRTAHARPARPRADVDSLLPAPVTLGWEADGSRLTGEPSRRRAGILPWSTCPPSTASHATA